MKTEIKDKIDDACKNFKEVNESNKIKFSKLDDWLLKESEEFKKEIKNTKQTYFKYKRGQVLKINFGVNIGTELSHTHFAIVLNNDDTRLTDNITVIPLTSKAGYRRINLGNLVSQEYNSSKYKNDSFAIITQIKTVSKKRVLENDNKIICPKNILSKLDNAIKDYLTKSAF